MRRSRCRVSGWGRVRGGGRGEEGAAGAYVVFALARKCLCRAGRAPRRRRSTLARARERERHTKPTVDAHPNNNNQPTHQQPTHQDASVVAAYHQLRAVNARAEIFCELLLPGDIAYLSPLTPLPGVGVGQEWLSPAYLAGHVFVPDMFDTLMAQSFFNGGGDRLLLKLLK